MADARLQGYDVLAHIPAGVALTRDMRDQLVAAWAAVGYDVVPPATIVGICGPARTIGSIRKWTEWDGV